MFCLLLVTTYLLDSRTETSKDREDQEASVLTDLQRHSLNVASRLTTSSDAIPRADEKICSVAMDVLLEA